MEEFQSIWIRGDVRFGAIGDGDRGGIDKNLRKIICPKINFEVWKL
jgi:hypothetical protein